MSVFKGPSLIYKYNVEDILQENLKEWLKYGFLEAGGYTNIQFNLPTSGYTTLQGIHDDRYKDGQVYEMFGPGLVFETDIIPNGATPQPLICSGVWVNKAFYPTSGINGAFNHIVDFSRGRVIFNAPVNNSIIESEYCIRDIGVYTSDTTEWKTVVNAYSDQYTNTSKTAPSGLSSILKEKRVWMPSVFVELQDRDHIPLQIGGGEYADFHVFYHIISDRPSLNKSVMGIINDQEGKTINLFDPNISPKSYNYDGSVAVSGISYKALQIREGPYFWRNAWIEKSTGTTINDKLLLFRGEVKQKILIERYGYPGDS